MTWLEEYKRLEAFSSYDCQTVEVDQRAWFVKFSPNGKKMVTTTRAGGTFIWTATTNPGDSKSISCNLKQSVTIQEPGGEGSYMYESYVCCFSPDSRYLLVMTVNAALPVHICGTAFVFDAESGMQQVGAVHHLAFHLTCGKAWITDTTYVGCVWNPSHQTITVSAYSAVSPIAEQELFSFDCGPQKFIKKIVHLRVLKNNEKKCYCVVAVVRVDQSPLLQHRVWAFSAPITSNSCSSKIPLDIGKCVDLDCMVCGMDVTPTWERLLMVCTVWPKENTHGICDIKVYVYDPLTLVRLLSFPSCQLILYQYHIFIGVSEDYFACGDESGRVTVWDLHHAVKVFEMTEHNSMLNSVAWHPIVPGLFATASDDCFVKLWHVGH
jgi:WD40 repeat protein